MPIHSLIDHISPTATRHCQLRNRYETKGMVRGMGMVIRDPGGIELRSINNTRSGANDAVPFAMTMLKAATLCLEGS